jgi:hydrogenase expression/formation protein HypC
MCIAVSGKILSLEGNYAKVDVAGNICEVSVLLVKPRVGDYALIHAGCAIDLVKKETHDDLHALWKEIESYAHA